MKKLFTLLAAGGTILSLIGCTSVKRFSSATYKGTDPSLVDMELFSANFEQVGNDTRESNLWDLSAGAQTQFVQILDRRYPENDQFMEALARTYPEEWSQSPGSLTEKKLRMIFTIRKKRDYTVINDASGRFSPADRIEYLRFRITLPESDHLRFTQWNRFTTEYGEMEIAGVTFSRSLQVEGEGTLGEVEVGTRGILGRNEQQELRSRFLKLNGSMGDRWIEMEEEGTREIDLTGNVMADVQLRFDGFPEKLAVPIFETNGEELPGLPRVKGLILKEVLVPWMKEAPDTLRALLQVEYIYRHVQAGWKTFQEWDDQVEYYSGTLEKEISLFTRSEYVPAFYGIGTRSGGSGGLRVRSRNGNEYPLQFGSYQEASQFRDWLYTLEGPGPVRCSGYTLLYGATPLRTEKLTEGIEMKVMPVFRPDL
jgi:hypothetical protein